MKIFFSCYYRFLLVGAAKCLEKQPNCMETGGHCIQEEDGDENIKCICKASIIPYTKESGCNGIALFNENISHFKNLV